MPKHCDALAKYAISLDFVGLSECPQTRALPIAQNIVIFLVVTGTQVRHFLGLHFWIAEDMVCNSR